jgi:formylglycine-generating enzyme required for sulfatase activity
MVYLPAGQTLVGPGPNHPEMVYALEPGAVDVGGFCIDRLEAHDEAGLPIARVTWEEAHDACDARGARLCGELEWATACRGHAGRRYSYGDTFEPGRCYTEDAPDYTVAALRPTGSHRDCSTPEGVYDLNGSVAEWTADAHPGPAFPSDGGTPDRHFRVLRGGTMWAAAYGQDCLSRHWHAERQREADDGYRCCTDPIAGQLDQDFASPRTSTLPAATPPAPSLELSR